MKHGLTYAVMTMAILLPCVSGFSKPKLYDCDGKMNEAIKKYQQKRYSAVQTILADVKFQCSGSAMMDTVLYYTGMADLKLKSNIEAKSEFERLARDLPLSPFAPEAQFRIGYAIFMQSNPPDRDQTETKDAIRAFKQFLEDHAGGPFVDSANAYIALATGKLADKEFRNAKFYEKISEYESAVVYYRSLLQDYSDTKFAAPSRLNMAEDLINLKRYDEARDVLNELERTSKDGEILKKAAGLRSRLK